MAKRIRFVGTVTIVGMTYKVYRVRGLCTKKGEHMDGQCDNVACRIHLDEKGSPDTLLHELIHAIVEALRLKIKHRDVYAMARVMWASGVRLDLQKGKA